MADNDEKSDHGRPATLVERAASAGVGEAERVLREGGATRGHIFIAIDGLDAPENELEATSAGYRRCAPPARPSRSATWRTRSRLSGRPIHGSDDAIVSGG